MVYAFILIAVLIVTAALITRQKHQSPADDMTNVTPNPPTVTADDATNTISVSHDTLPDSEILLSENDEPFKPMP